MSMHPFPVRRGRPMSLRASIYKRLDLVASVSGGHPQHAALAAGRAVRFSTSQLVGLYRVSDDPTRPWSSVHPSLPDTLEDHDAWVLTGDDTLTPTT